MSYVDKINFNGTDYDIQDSYAARSVEGNTSSHVLQANEIYTESSQSDFAQFIYRTAGGTASIATGNAILVAAYGLCYQPAGNSTEETLGVAGSFSNEDTTVELTAATWRGQVTDSGTYEFSYDGTNWLLNETTVTLADYGLVVTGTVTSGDTITVTFVAAVFNTIYVATPTSFVATGFNQYDATAGYAHVVGGNQYRIDGTYTSLGFTTTVGGTTTTVTVTDNKFTPEEDGYIYVNGASGNILIALVWSGTMDSEEWSAYSESTITVPTEDADGNALPTASYGLPGIGSVDDSINFEEGIYTQRIGRLAYSADNLATVKAMGVTYIFDSANIFYVLAEAVTYTLDNQAYTYTVNDYGTEEWVGTAVPIYTGLRYGNSLVDKLRNLADIQEIGDNLELEDGVLDTKHDLLDDVPSGFFSGDATVSGEGTDITLENTMPVALKSVQLNGDTEQDGTPTPDDPVDIDVVTGTQEVVVRGSGQNLLNLSADFTLNNVRHYVKDGSLWLNGTTTTETGGSNALYKSNLAFTLPAGTYTFKQFAEARITMYLKKMSDDSNICDTITSSVPSRTFTLAESTEVYIGFYLYSVTYTKANLKLVLVEGTSADEYAEFGQSFSIDLDSTELCKIGDYQDSIFKVGSDWYLHKEVGKVVLDGSESWQTNSGWNGEDTTIFILSSISSTSGGLSSHFVYSANTYVSTTAAGYFGVVWGTARAFRVSNSIASNVSDFQTWLASNNVTVYYFLTTPTTTQITDATLISELNALAAATGYNDNTYITNTASSGLPAELEVTAYQKNLAGIVANL